MQTDGETDAASPGRAEAPHPLRAHAGELLLAGSVGVLLLEVWEAKPHLDDAFISYRYARNLAEGHGLVYNVGEYVEGFTNLLWTLLIAGGLALGFEAKPTAHGLGVASSVATLVATFTFARTALPRAQAWLAGLAPWVVLASFPMIRWAASGMEAPLFTACVTFALAAQARDRIGWATLALALATLTRPDGALFAAVVYGFHVLRRRREGPRVLAAPLAYAGVLGALTLFRLVYYEALLPNTFYAKVGGTAPLMGVLHVALFYRGGPGLLLVPGLAALRDPRFRPAAVAIPLASAYVAFVGGSWGFRFLLPILPAIAVLGLRGVREVSAWQPRAAPFAAVLLAAGAAAQVLGQVPLLPGVALAAVAATAAAAIGTRRPRRVALAGLGATALVLVALGMALPASFAALRERLAHPERNALLARTRARDRALERLNRATADLLLQRGEPIRLVAIGAIGTFGYRSRLPILDIFGLTDRTIARTHRSRRSGAPVGHLRSNADYVLSRRPDYILIPRRGSERGAERAAWLPAVRELWAHPDLRRDYVWDPAVRGYRIRRRRTSSPLPAPGVEPEAQTMRDARFPQ